MERNLEFSEVRSILCKYKKIIETTTLSVNIGHILMDKDISDILSKYRRKIGFMKYEYLKDEIAKYPSVIILISADRIDDTISGLKIRFRIEILDDWIKETKHKEFLFFFKDVFDKIDNIYFLKNQLYHSFLTLREKQPLIFQNAQKTYF